MIEHNNANEPASTAYDLRHISFEGKPPLRPRCSCARGPCRAALVPAEPAPEGCKDEFIDWALDRAGLDAAAYRMKPLRRRLPACLRALKVQSTEAARALLERGPSLLAVAVDSLLLGVTEFFRDGDVFESVRTVVLPRLARRRGPLRIWSAGCSTGEELYSVAILLAEAGLLDRSFLLGTDCRPEAIERAKAGLYRTAATDLVPCALRARYFEPTRFRRTLPGARTDDAAWRPIEALRRQVYWKVADVAHGVEAGPWDVILWRNMAIYLEAAPAQHVWRRLSCALTPEGFLIAGKAERPPHGVSLTSVARCVYRSAVAPAGRIVIGGTVPRTTNHMSGQPRVARTFAI
jgi:chemotaxis protein methyltransferase CheR